MLLHFRNEHFNFSPHRFDSWHNISVCHIFLPPKINSFVLLLFFFKDLRNKKHETKNLFFPFYYFVTNKIKRWSFTCRGGWCHRTERETRTGGYTWRNLNFQKNRFTQKGREFLKSCKTFKNCQITLFNI